MIQKEKPKQETLEEVKDLNYWRSNAEEDYLQVPISVLRYISELEMQQERSYSEEEVLDILDHHTSYLETFIYQYIDRQDIEVNEEWFEQFKKK